MGQSQTTATNSTPLETESSVGSNHNHLRNNIVQNTRYTRQQNRNSEHHDNHDDNNLTLVRNDDPKEQFKFIRDCYSKITKFMVGMDENSKGFQCEMMNEDVLKIVLDFCGRRELQSFSQTCKYLRNMMKSDMYYWPQIVRIERVDQLVTYLKTNTYFFNCDYYTKIAQATNYANLEVPAVILIKNLTLYQKGEHAHHEYIQFPFLSQVDWENIRKMRTSNGSGIITDRLYQSCQVDIVNLLLETLISIRREIKSKKINSLDFVEPNYRCGIRDYRNFFNSHPRLAFLLKTRELEDYESNGPVELEKQEDDFLLAPLDPKEAGKPVLFNCNFCKAKVGGFTCLNCNKLFEIASDLNGALCSKCNVTLQRPTCCRQPMQIGALEWNISPLPSGEPNFHCKCSKSSMTCRCFACSSTGQQGTCFKKKGLFSRFKRSGYFKCPNKCGGAYHCERFKCSKCDSMWDLDKEL